MSASRVVNPALVAVVTAFAAVIAFGAIDEAWNDPGVAAPRADLALIAIGAKSAARFARLLGAYSQYGFAHPGPLGSYVLAPFLAIGGDRPGTLHVGAALVAAIVLARHAAVFVVDGERSRATLVAGATTCLALAGFAAAHRLGPPVSSPWNPVVATFATLAAASSATRLRRGDARALPFLVFAHALAAQEHASAAIVATAIALGGAWRPPSIPRRIAALAALVFALVWTPVAVEAIAHDGGNLVALVRFATADAHGASPSATSALRAIGWVPAGLAHAAGHSGALPTSLLAAYASLVIGTALVVRRSADPSSRASIDVGLVGVASALVLVPVLDGHRAIHLAYPLGAASIHLHAALVHAALPRSADGPSTQRHVGGAAALLALVASVAIAAFAQRDARVAALRTFPGEAHASARLAAITRCVAGRSEVAIEPVGRLGWVLAASAAWTTYASGRVPMLPPDERGRFGDELAYGAPAARAARPRLFVRLGTRSDADTTPTDGRAEVALGSIGVVALALPEGTDPTLGRCLHATARR